MFVSSGDLTLACGDFHEIIVLILNDDVANHRLTPRFVRYIIHTDLLTKHLTVAINS